MARKINTSVNIIRDSGKDINYIPTHNAIKTVKLISNDFKKGPNISGPFLLRVNSSNFFIEYKLITIIFISIYRKLLQLKTLNSVCFPYPK